MNHKTNHSHGRNIAGSRLSDAKIKELSEKIEIFKKLPGQNVTVELQALLDELMGSLKNGTDEYQVSGVRTDGGQDGVFDEKACEVDAQGRPILPKK